MEKRVFDQSIVGIFPRKEKYLYFCYKFSDFGGNFQSKIHNLIIDKINYKRNGKILDIGDGSVF